MAVVESTQNGQHGTVFDFDDASACYGVELSSGEAIAVPPDQRGAVLHLHESISLSAIKHHQTAQYLAAPEQREYVMSSIPQGHMATTRDVANAVAFLASNLANSTTGTSLLVDGGWTAK